MNRWLLARVKAYQVRKAVEASAERELYGRELINAIVEDERLFHLERPADDPLLAGDQARYRPREKLIVVSRDVSEELRVLHTAHELGHHFLHTRTASCGDDDLNPSNVVLTLPYAEGRIATYHPRQMQENEATVFATELLAPSSRTTSGFDDGLNATDLALRFQAPRYAVLSQMATVLLGPAVNFEELIEEAEEPPFHWHELDPTQKQACCVPKGPVLVQAGPGTGKTRTLTSRAEWLISERGVNPEQILALTFSNKATEELRFRLRRTIPDLAHRVTVSTFHGFGLELLRRYCDVVGLPADFSVLDPVEAELLLEENLAGLELEYFSNPAVPGQYLADILAQIAQAKGELIGPTEYMELVDAMEDDELSEDDHEVVEKCREVGRVYQEYEDLLQEKGVVDYGDLLIKPIQILQDDRGKMKQLRAQYAHILVDEYQDINRANGKLVQLLAGDKGESLWAVGDIRQSIYRWRGATPTYIRDFSNQYPDADQAAYSLDVNYRASEQLLGFVRQVAAQMNLALPAPEWKSSKGLTQDSSIRVALATDKEAEWRGIADTIKEHVEDGMQYSDVAVLCRTNSQASEITRALTWQGIPTLHLGRFFFRKEVKDLLAVLSMSVEGHGVTWPRVATLIRDPLPMLEAARQWMQMQELDQPFPGVIREIKSEDLSQPQREDLERLVGVIEPFAVLEKPSPWLILVEFLFEFGDYLRGLHLSDDPAKGQALLAVAQTLNLAGAFSQRPPLGAEENPARAFLDHIRRLIRRNDQNVDLPITDVEINAVRVLTIHKAKGLEFPVVFVPNLAARRFPSRGRPNSPVPTVSGLLSVSEEEEAVEEESCLFVAISRAEEHIVLSRAESYHLRLGKPVSRAKSDLWDLLDPGIANVGDVARAETWNEPLPLSDLTNDWREDPTGAIVRENMLEERALRIFHRRCPRQFFYRYGLGLVIRDERGVYLQFFTIFHQIADWLRRSFSEGEVPDWSTVLARLDEAFLASMPEDHVHASWYRQQAEAQLNSLWAHLQSYDPLAGELRSREPVEVEIDGLRVQLHIDEILEEDDRLGVTHYRTGRFSKSHLDDTHLTLVRRALQDTTDKTIEVNICYLATGEVVEAPADKDAEILQSLAQDISKLRSGYFPPEPRGGRSWLTCGSCSYLLLCPRGE